MESTTVDPKTLWFDTPDTFSLCRGGNNGSNHPSQLYAIKKYVKPHTSFLDYGSGSGTTLEALVYWNQLPLEYKGLDIIPKNVEWCKEHFKGYEFEVNKTIHKIDQPDKSWDTVYSRHVVDHMASFEDALSEHCRVAKSLVIIVLWVPPGDMPEHQIKHIVDQGKTYENEYTNQYSKGLIIKALEEKAKDGWKLMEYKEEVGAEVRGHDTVLVLGREIRKAVDKASKI